MHFLHNIIKIIKSMRIRRVGHETHTKEKRNSFSFSGKPWKKREQSQDLGVDERILKWTLNKWDVIVRSGSRDFGSSQVAASKHNDILRVPYNMANFLTS